PSGRISPTSAAHVLQGLDGRIDAVIDAGDCDVGVESTIVGLTGTPTLLRPGGLPQEALEDALGQPLTLHKAEATLTAPGQMLSHYAPRLPVRLNAAEAQSGE